MRKRTVGEGNFVLENNFVQKKSFFVRIIAHLFIIVEGEKIVLEVFFMIYVKCTKLAEFILKKKTSISTTF